MILKSIEMKGFKSFPHKTQMSFPNGIVSIIGPNGSGKSNVLDAVRWVLGEKSAKNLRGEKMEDVIFSGTKIHKSMNFCEVEIIFGNEDQFLNIEFSEVAIKRRAYRNGESKFYINDRLCRQKDIKELLLDSGIGKEGYSIISQGRIDEIVNSNPLQRRKIFEEACKISKNRYQKEESEKKLENVKENLERINDIYYEIEKQIKPLKTQSENATKYIQLKSELKKSDVNRLILEITEVQKEYDQLQNLLEEKNTAIEILENEFSQKKEKEEKLGKDIDEIYKNLENVNDQKNNLVLAKGNLENQISSSKLFLENSDRQFQKSLDQISKTTDSKEKSKEEYNKAEEELNEAKQKLKNLNQTKEVLEEEEKDLEQNLNHIQTEIENNKEQIITLMNKKSFISSQINEIQGQKNQDKEKIKEVENIKQSQEEKIESIKSKLQIEKALYEKEEQKLTNIVNEQEELEESIKSHRNLAEKQQIEIANLIGAIKSLESKKNVFDEMQAHYEGMSSSVKSILKEKTLTGIIDVLANIIKVDEEYEKTIEAALGGAIQNIVTKSSEDAKKAIEFLKIKKSGRATFLPIDAVKGQEWQLKNVTIASQIVKCDPMYKDIIKQLLGRTIVVNSMEEGIKAAKDHSQKYKIVTKQGEIFNIGGAITGGAYIKSGNILSRKREISQLKLQIEQESLKKNQLDLVRKGCLDIIEDIQNQKIELEKTAKEQKANLENLKLGLMDKENKLNYEKEKLQQMEFETEDAKNTQKSSEERLSNLEEEEKNLTQKIDTIKTSLDQQIKDNNTKQENLTKLSQKIAALREEASSYQGQLETRNILLKQSKEIYEEITSRCEEYNLEYQQLKISLEETKNQLVILEKQLEEAAKNLEKYQSQEIDIKNTYNDIKEKVATAKEDVKHMEQQRFISIEQRYQIESKLSKVENIITNSSSKLLEEYNLSLEEAMKLKDEEANTSKSHISKLKASIGNLGNINLDAIEEYEKVNQRYLLFSTQKNDLELSLEELTKITQNIEKSMRKEFKKEFTKINDLFKITFKELFGGGEGELVLSDEDDILNCEIEIHAQPPGKKLKNISVMSGGEKALTAIAILFAILMTRPTPFCFLDEIDAPLDDVNIYRYNKYIQGLAKETQFITITHRRGTMEASDYIYGVTMEDKGVSKIVSLKLEEAENYIEN